MICLYRILSYTDDDLYLILGFKYSTQTLFSLYIWISPKNSVYILVIIIFVIITIRKVIMSVLWLNLGNFTLNSSLNSANIFSLVIIWIHVLYTCIHVLYTCKHVMYTIQYVWPSIQKNPKIYFFQGKTFVIRLQSSSVEIS